MERKNYFIAITLVFMFISVLNFASNREKIYKAYISGKMDVWKSIIDQIENNKGNNIMLLQELVNYQYGYIGWCLGNDAKKDARTYLKLAEDNLEILENNNVDASFINTYKSAFYAFKIGLSPMRAPFLGPKSMKYAELAIEQDNKNPIAYILNGNNYLYMPAVFGGSKEIAIENFIKSIQLFESNQEKLINNWNYLSVLTLAGQTYEENNNYNDAKKYYEKALKIEPDFQWVKEELYPNILKQKEQNE